MSTIESNVISPEALAELEEAVRYAMLGKRDPEAMRQACQRMDRLREENRQQFGVQNVAVELIRDARR